MIKIYTENMLEKKIKIRRTQQKTNALWSGPGCTMDKGVMYQDYLPRIVHLLREVQLFQRYDVFI